MRLYRSTKNATQWFAFNPVVGWVMFPAEIGGWQKRQPACRMNRIDIREVPLRLGFNTGIPGAPMFASGGSDAAAAEEHGEPDDRIRVCQG
jgi:hypothetical protein